MNKTIITTSWDDGHKLDIKLSRLLKKYNIKATFYISPKNHEFRGVDLLSSIDIKELSKYFEIGAHTLTHPHLSKITLKEAEAEIKNSKDYLEGVIDKKITAFCYPYGDYNKQVIELVRKHGFLLARTTTRYSFSLPKDDFQTATTFHTYNHYSDILRIVAFSNLNLSSLVQYTQWDNLAIDLFQRALKKKAVFHLWGHSWEFEKYKSWDRLERVFAAISNNPNVIYATNSQLIK